MSTTLTKEDQDRIDNLECYQRHLNINKNLEYYKDLAIGEVYYIKFQDWNKQWRYETTGYGKTKSKFYVFHKDDDGFVFVKRILASGRLSKEVICLTTSYNHNEHVLEADPNYVNSILLENEDGYDPMAEEKAITAKKNKARRKNKKLELNFKDDKEAYEHMKTFKVGNRIYDCDTAYGSGMATWEITEVIKRKTDRKKDTQSWYRHDTPGSTEADREHNRAGFKNLIVCKIKCVDNDSNRTWGLGMRDLTFHDLTWRTYYKEKPYNPETV